MTAQPDRDFALTPDKKTDHISGPESALATLIEYGDLECPSCRQAQGAVALVRQRFGQKLRFVFRHFPLREVHPHAELAAEAAEAAGAQGKFWPYIDLLFEHQSHLKEKNLSTYAEQLELDMVRFHAEMKDHVYMQRVNEHIDLGNRLHIRATPTFFVDGALVDVSFGFKPLEQAIERKLQRK